MTRELTHEQKRRGFIRATQSFASSCDRWKDRAEKGMTDEDLAAALKSEIGIYGGASSWDDVPAYTVQGDGLRIWLSWGFPNTYSMKPTFQGAATIAMARRVYGIRRPDDKQMDLFAGA